MENSSLTKIKNGPKEIIFTILGQSYFKLYKKYSSNRFSFNTICINNIIFNESCLIVAKFKDFLIYDDNTEFIRKFYKKLEAKLKLYKILELYENYSKIFPNYLVLYERKFMYKNIKRKQKMIDAFNQIKLEEEENRKKIIEKQKNNESKDNIIFTDLIKDEIKKFQKDNNYSKNYKNNFDSEIDNNADTLYGLSHSSISINLIKQNDLLSSSNKSFYSKNNGTKGTISDLLNVMNDSKIYIADLPNIFKINHFLSSDNNNKIIKEKILSFKNNKYIKEINNGRKNICNNNQNFKFLQKNILTMEKEEKEIKKSNINFRLNSTLINRKKIKRLDPYLINSNSTSINKEKNRENRQNICIPSIRNTIININNNYFSNISKTERFEQDKLSKRNSKFNTVQNNSREKENKILRKKLILSKLLNQKRIKNKNTCQDLSYKRYSSSVTYYNNNLINKVKRELSPKFGLELNYRKNINIQKEKKSEIKIKNNFKNKTIENKINNKTNKNQKEMKEKIKKIENLKNKNKLSINEFSSLSFINIVKTESSLKKKIANNIKTKKLDNFKEKTKTSFSSLKNKNFRKNKILTDKFLTTFKKSNVKKAIFKEDYNDLINKRIKQNKLYKSRDKNNNYKKSTKIQSIKKKIFKSEIKPLTKRFISNCINKSLIKKSRGIKNNFIDYSTISSKNGISNRSNEKILLNSKSLIKNKKCESLDFSNEYHNNKILFFKNEEINSKRNSYIYSPKNSFTSFKNQNNKNNKILNGYFTEKPFKFIQSFVPKQPALTPSQNDKRKKYKNILLTKNNKKSYDFNSDIQRRYKQSILNKINNLKNNNNSCLSFINKNSYSIDLNNLNNNIKFYQNSFKKSKEKFQKNNNKDLFNKIMSFKISNKNKKEEELSKNSNNNIFPLTIKVNTDKFLSKIKRKNKKQK